MYFLSQKAGNEVDNFDETGFKLFFVESICDDPKIIEANILEVKVTSPDYKHFDKETILHDFLERINHYEKLYETLDENLEPDLAYLKIFDTGRKVTVHKHEGHIQARIVYYLMNVRITPRTIYLTRHGESYNNVIGIQLELVSKELNPFGVIACLFRQIGVIVVDLCYFALFEDFSL